ncbi:MAG: hypothetical protein EAZ36_00645, partial [Verrucomicrobia bacterium]
MLAPSHQATFAPASGAHSAGEVAPLPHSAPGREPGSAAAHDIALAEDHRLLAAWHEELAARREERVRLQAHHRDRIEDALDHLESLRQNTRDRQADIASIGLPSALATEAADSSAAADSTLNSAPANHGPTEPSPAPIPFSPEDLATYRLPTLDL